MKGELLKGEAHFFLLSYGKRRTCLLRGEVCIRELAPLGDPVEVNVRDYELSLRKADAEMIEVE